MTTATDFRDPAATAPNATSFQWRMVMDSLKRPYRVTLPMVVLVLLVPFYLYIAEETRNRAMPVPELALDRVLPVQPAWAIVYGALYLFLIVLPLFVVRQDEQIRRTVLAYLMVWVTAYVCFLFY